MIWQNLLEGLGAILSFFYDVIPSYGVAIILLTLTVRVVLIPLTIKQTRSMHAMQKIQPQLKALQQKHKGDRQKLNEEVMKLYKEHQVNPLGGCLPLVLQLPVFIALYSVLRGDPNKAAALHKMANPAIAHLPDGSALAQAIDSGNAGFLGMNLSCSPLQAGKGIVPLQGGVTIDCGTGWTMAIPFFILVGLMVFTTFYQQRQMQSSTGQQPAQAQLMMKIMPAFLGFISLSIPAGVLVYWVTTNLWQVGQQAVMLRGKVQSGPPGPAKSGAPAPPRAVPPKSSGKKNAGNRKKRRKR
jgi:YidC/Oxa1 family membrane protein insertase